MDRNSAALLFPARDGPVNLVVILEYHGKPASQESGYTNSKGPKIEVAKKLQISTGRRTYSQIVVFGCFHPAYHKLGPGCDMGNQ
jgi:hypothetical protein